MGIEAALISFSVAVSKYSDKNNLRGKEFILAQGSRVTLHHSRKSRQWGLEADDRINPKSETSSDDRILSSHSPPYRGQDRHPRNDPSYN